MKKIATATLTTALLAAAVAAASPAQASETGFVYWLADHGENVSTTRLATASVGLGYSICNLYRVTQSNDEVNRVMRNNGYSAHNSAVWTVGSITQLCPQYSYLLGI